MIFLFVIFRPWYVSELFVYILQVHNNQTKTRAESQFYEDEIQEIRTSFPLIREVQLISLLGPPEAVTANGTFALVWGKKLSSRLTFNATASDFYSAIDELLSAQCEYSARVSMGSSSLTLYSSDFEANNGGWISYLADYAPILSDASAKEPFCGRKSLYFPVPWGEKRYYSSGTEAGYNVTQFPYICMAYSIPAGVSVNMIIEAEVEVKAAFWWEDDSITIEQFSIGLSGPPNQPFDIRGIGAWASVTADGNWHYDCLDLASLFQNYLGM